jgi:hypothetical protein
MAYEAKKSRSRENNVIIDWWINEKRLEIQEETKWNLE